MAGETTLTIVGNLSAEVELKFVESTGAADATFTIVLDPRGALTVRVARALDYPPEHVPQLLAAAVADELAQPTTSDEVEHEDVAVPVPAPRAAAKSQLAPPAPEPDPARGRLRKRVLRALDNGATVDEAAQRFGIDPSQIDQWDDDAALDGRADLLANPAGWHRTREAS